MSQELLNASLDCDLDKIKHLLIDNSIDINYTNENGWSALINACYRGDLDIVEFLLTSKDLKEHANMYHKDSDGWNVLIFASICGHWHISEFLIIERNFEVDEKTMNWLIEENKTETISLIQTRELYQKLNSNLSTNDKVIKPKKI